MAEQDELDIPRGSNGKPLVGRALEVALARQARLKAAEDAGEDVAAVARMVCRLAARATGLPAPDAMAAIGAPAGASGRDDALRVLRAAGVIPVVQAQRWQDEAPVHAQHSTGPGWDRDPEHHPEVTALLTSGASLADVNEKIREIAGQQAREREEQMIRNRPGVLWETREGELRDGGHATPLRPQQSMVHNDVPPLGERTG